MIIKFLKIYSLGHESHKLFPEKKKLSGPISLGDSACCSSHLESRSAR